MKIFVTGGAGFIGSHIVDSLLKKGHDVVIYDDMSSGYSENIEDAVSKGASFTQGSILDYAFMKEKMKGCDIVSHHAAQLEIMKSIYTIKDDAQINIMGTINVLEAAVHNNISKVIFASSAAVYGEPAKIFIPTDEQAPKIPHWSYGVSKMAGELYCQQYYLFHGLKSCWLRYGIVYGEREWYGRVLTLFIKRLMEGKPPIIFGDGKQKEISSMLMT
jgi:UDP-glucose 4-epimerase